jgi:thioesterase domain-containing protein
LVSRIRKEFGREVPISFLLQSPTIERLAVLLRQNGSHLKRSAVVPIRAEGVWAPFFCVHPVGGNVLCYAPLARQLGTEQPFYAFQSPEPEQHTIEAMAEHYSQQMLSVQPEGPYRLGGWSMGGVIAFEMARQLAEKGEDVQLLALIDCYAPQSIARPEHFDLLRMFVEDIEGTSGRSLGFSLDELRQLSLEVLLERARVLEFVPDELGPAELQGLFELYRANLSALLAYEPRPYAGKVTLFRSAGSDVDPARGWMPYAPDLDVFEIEGDHYSIINGPPVKVLAERLGKLLNE